MTPSDFFGAAKLMPLSAFGTLAKELNVEPEVLQAIAKKETRGRTFIDDGRLNILFEPHKFNHFTGGEYLTSHPDLATKNHTENKYGPPGAFQYQKLAKAMALDEEAALKATSWGFWQCMGFNHKIAGFDTVQEMVLAFGESEEAQLKAFGNYIKAKGLIVPMQLKNWEMIAYLMNGKAWRKNNYAQDIKKYYEELTSNVLRRGSTGHKVITLQQLLVKHGAKVKLDGVFGQETEDALKGFQQEHQLAVDGVAGPETFRRLAEVKVEVKPAVKSKRVVGAVGLGGLGIGGIVESVQAISESVKESADHVQQAAKATTETLNTPAAQQTVDVVATLVRQNQQNQLLMLGMFIIMVGFAGFFIWTKFYDDKKMRN